MLSTDAANLISVDFRSVRSRLFDFLAKEMLIGHLARENVIGRKTVELTMRPTVKLGHGLFKNTDDVVIRIRLLWEEILVLHGFIPGLGHTVGVDYFYLSDDSSDHNVFSFEEYGNLAFILRSSEDCRIHVQKSKGSGRPDAYSSCLFAEPVSFFPEYSRIGEECILTHASLSIGHHAIVDGSQGPESESVIGNIVFESFLFLLRQLSGMESAAKADGRGCTVLSYPSNGDEDRSVEIDDSEKSLVGSEKSGILTDSMKCINIREEGIVGVKADDVRKISVLPVADCGTRNNLSFFFCEEPVLCFEDENGSVRRLSMFASDVNNWPDCLHGQAA